MLAEQHDLIVFGAGLAGQTAATLLALQNYRVLLLESGAPDDVPPPACCPALDQLLASLDAQQLPRHTNDRFQLVTDDIRLEVCGALPLDQELEREFPGHHAAILALLARLDAWGKKLSLLLAGPAPDSPWRSTRSLALYRRQLQQGLPARGMGQPVDRLLATLGDKQARQALLQLLSGLSLRPPARLSTAEAALNWHIATCSQHIGFKQLTELLNDRFIAAGGRSLPLEELDELQWQGKRLESVRLRDGSRLQARQYLTGPCSPSIELPPAMAPALRNSEGAPQCWVVSGVNYQRPHILAPRVILGGEPPLHLTWAAQKDSLAQIQMSCPAEPAITDLGPLKKRLARLLPFADLQLTPGPDPEAGGGFKTGLWPHKAQPQPIAKNLLFCHGADLLPTFTGTGSLMLGQAAAGLLKKRLG